MMLAVGESSVMKITASNTARGLSFFMRGSVELYMPIVLPPLLLGGMAVLTPLLMGAIDPALRNPANSAILRCWVV
jgi:hypothetical protein